VATDDDDGERQHDAAERTLWARLIVSVTLVAVAVTALIQDVDVGTGVVVLIALAVLPWLGEVLESLEVGGLGVKYRSVDRKLRLQQSQLDAQQEIITNLVKFGMAQYIFAHLRGILVAKRTGTEYRFDGSEAMQRDLRFLRDHGYLEHFYVRGLDHGANLAAELALTPIGELIVQLREPVD
jgi:hypothetical protein